MCTNKKTICVYIKLVVFFLIFTKINTSLFSFTNFQLKKSLILFISMYENLKRTIKLIDKQN